MVMVLSSRLTAVMAPEKVLFPYPHPKALGLILDPKEKAVVLRVDYENRTMMRGRRA